MTQTVRELLIAFTVVIAFKLLPRSTNFLATCEDLSLRAPKGKYDDLCEFGPGGSRYRDAKFWADSHGIQGLVERMEVSYFYLQLIQAHRRARTLDLEDCAYIWKKLFQQLIFSALAMPEAFFGMFIKLNHRAARKSLGFYCDLLLRANTLCFSASNHMCPINTPELL